MKIKIYEDGRTTEYDAGEIDVEYDEDEGAHCFNFASYDKSPIKKYNVNRGHVDIATDCLRYVSRNVSGYELYYDNDET